MVGIMRNGQMIAEDTPSNLLKIYHVNSLESLFLSLCKQQEIIQQSPGSLKLPESIETVNTSSCLIAKKGFDLTSSFKRISALIIKNYKVMFRNLW